MREKQERAPKPKVKVDPALVAKARELRDRWMDQLNAGNLLGGEGKYDVGRAIASTRAAEPRQLTSHAA